MAQRKAVMTPAKKSALQWIQANEPWLSQVHKDIWNFHETRLAGVPLGRVLRGPSAPARLRGRGRHGHHADGIPGHLEQRSRAPARPSHRFLCRIRRRSRQQPGPGALREAARRRAQICGRPYRPPFRARRRGAGGVLAAKAAMETARASPARSSSSASRRRRSAARSPCMRPMATMTISTPPVSFHPAYFRSLLQHDHTGTPIAAPIGARCTPSSARIPSNGRPWARATDSANPAYLGPRARRDRCRVPDVHDVEVYEGGDAAPHGHLDHQRGDPRRRTGDRRQPGAEFQPDPVRQPRADPGDAGAHLLPCSTTTPSMSAAITHCTAAQGMGDEDPARSAQSRHGRSLLRQPGAGRSARLGRGRAQVRPRDPEEPRPEADERPALAGDGGAVAAGRGRSDIAPGTAVLAEELYVGRLYRLHMALSDGAPDDRPRHAGARRSRAISIRRGSGMRSAAIPRDHRSHGLLRPRAPSARP